MNNDPIRHQHHPLLQENYRILKEMSIESERSSDGLNLKLPTEMAEIKVAKKTIFFPEKDSWSSPQIIPPGDFHIGQVLINKYGLKT